MKKIIGILFLLQLLLFPLFSFAESTDVEVDGIFYTIYSDGEAVVIRNPNEYSGDIVIPEKFSYKGKPYKVACIGKNAFRSCYNLTSVIMPNSVIRIEEDAFSCCGNLRNVTLSDSLKRIGRWAFNDCKKLDEIKFPRKLTFIDALAFAGCESLKSLVIPQNVSYIEPGAFANCSGLKSIEVDRANSVFDSRNNCNAIIISSINSLHTGCINTIIPKDITEIGESAFERLEDLINITIPDGVKHIGDYAFSHSGLTTINIPNSVSHLGEYSFLCCDRLRSITIPEGVSVIDAWAFAGCDSLKSVTIKGNTSIGNDAFNCCPQLADVYIESTGNNPSRKGRAVFEYAAHRKTLHVKKEMLEYYKENGDWKYTFDKIVAIGSENDSNLNIFIISIVLISLLLCFIFYKRTRNNIKQEDK